MEVTLGCIVEGHGDREAVPILMRRLVARFDPSLIVHILPPIRLPKSKLLQPRELERAVDLAARKVGAWGALIVILDSDDDCPAILGPKLLKRATRARSDVLVSVVVAKREFESWFLAAAESLRGQRGLAPDIEGPHEPEMVRGAKEWLDKHMVGGRRYVETLDQPALAAVLDLDRARQADSFDKCYRDVMRLVIGLKGQVDQQSDCSMN